MKGQGLNLIELPSAMKKATSREEGPYALRENDQRGTQTGE